MTNKHLSKDVLVRFVAPRQVELSEELSLRSAGRNDLNC